MSQVDIEVGVQLLGAQFVAEFLFLPHFKIKLVKVKGILRLTVNRPVYLGVRLQLGPVTNFSFSLNQSLDNCGFVILWRPF
jgi:hypothetical protein